MPFVHAGNAALLAAFALTVLFVLPFDLGASRGEPRTTDARRAALWSGVWIALALAFGLATTLLLGVTKGVEFFTSYLVEKALSIDNLFAIVIVLRYFRVPASAERRVLGYGVLGAIVLRGAAILAGATLVARFHALTYALGALLTLVGARLLRSENALPTFAEGRLHRAVRRILPITTDAAGARFFSRSGGVLHATPLLLALLTIEATDLVFALDSIPAVLAVTSDPFIAFTSNIFAVLGLRALYSLASHLLERLRFLKAGLALVLVFAGAKMLVSRAIAVPASVTLVVVTLVIGGAVVASLLGKHGKERNPHAS
jgi:tellurite resistance protein TerC